MALKYGHSPLFVGKHHIHLKRVNSTNAYASDLVSKSKPIEGSVISASSQYAGKGQIGRSWESEAGKNLICSVILRPSFLQAVDQMIMNMSVALALHDLVSQFISHGTSIKWPNDIYVNDLKLAGILIQNTISGKHLDTSIIGTGINVNQKIFSPEIPNPASLSQINNRVIDLDEVMNGWFACLEKRYLELKKGNYRQIHQEYQSLLYRKNIESSFLYTETGADFIGAIQGVDLLGRLIIDIQNQGTRKFSFREIKYVI